MANINELLERLRSDLDTLAIAIRAKTGKTDNLDLAEMAAEQDAVFDAGKKAEYDRFWDSFQNNGKRRKYSYAFYNWTEECFNPKYDIIAGESAANIFAGALSGGNTSSPVNFVELLKSCGVVVDLSQATGVNYAFNNFGATHIGVCDFSKATAYNSVFGSCYQLVSIEKIIMPTAQTSGNMNWFGYCYALENLTIQGEIKLNGLNLSDSSKLTHDSLMSIINALEAKTNGTWTVTLGTTNLAKLTDAEKAIATQKGWTLA